MQKIDTWEFPQQAFNYNGLNFIVDSQGELLGQFIKDYAFIAGKNRFEQILPFGQGPDDLYSSNALCEANGLVYILEDNQIIKALKKIDGKYQRREIIYRKPGTTTLGRFSLQVSNEKIFVAGPTFESVSDERKEATMSYVKVYDMKGNYLKSLLLEQLKKGINPVAINQRLVIGSRRIFHFFENRLTVDVIDPQTLNTRRVDLEIPKGHVNPPEDFFSLTGYDGKNIYSVTEQWHTGFSDLAYAGWVAGSVVLQFRAPNRKHHYELVFFDAETFRIKGQIATDDYLMAARDNKLYFHEGGNPAYDETEYFKVVIYEIFL